MKTALFALLLTVASVSLLPAATYVGTISRDNPIGRFGYGSSFRNGGLGAPIFAAPEVTMDLDSGMTNVTNYKVSLAQPLAVNGLTGTFTDPITFQSRQVTLDVEVESASLVSQAMGPATLSSQPNGRLGLGIQNFDVLENSVSGSYQLSSPGLASVSGTFSENIPIMRPVPFDGEVDVAGFPDQVTLFPRGISLIIPPGPGYRVIDDSIGGIPVTFDIRFLDILYDNTARGELTLIPEPSSTALLGLAVLGCVLRRRRES